MDTAYFREHDPAERTTPYHHKAGVALYNDGAVKVIETTPTVVTARVSGENTRTVQFVLRDGALDWQCTCKKNQERFCKHAVAVHTYVRNT